MSNGTTRYRHHRVVRIYNRGSACGHGGQWRIPEVCVQNLILKHKVTSTAYAQVHAYITTQRNNTRNSVDILTSIFQPFTMTFTTHHNNEEFACMGSSDGRAVIGSAACKCSSFFVRNNCTCEAPSSLNAHEHTQKINFITQSGILPCRLR